MVLESGLQSTLKATITKPSLSNLNIGLKGLSKQRLRINGVKAASKEDLEREIVKLLQTPMTRAQLAISLNRNASTLWRDYLAPMLEKGLIEKEGDYYKRKGVSRQVIEQKKLEDLAENEFYQIPYMARFLEAVKRQPNRQTQLATFTSICYGRVVPSWKVNPEGWNEPETTNTFIDAYKAHFGVSELPRHIRMGLRGFLMYGLGLQLEKTAAADRGLSGKKDNAGAHGHVKLLDNEIESALELTKDDEELNTLFACWIEGFPRPERGLLIELSSFNFGQRNLEFAWVDGEKTPIVDPHAVRILKTQHIASQRQIQTFATLLRSAGVQVDSNVEVDSFVRFETVAKKYTSFRVRESKTDKLWPKFIFNEHCSAIVESWVKHRLKEGHRYMFYDGKQDVEESQEGVILKDYDRKTGLYGKLRRLYKDLGKGDPYFHERPAYALRHCGAHVWLRRSNYNYAIVAAMGWESVDVLMKFYGTLDEAQLFGMVLSTPLAAA